MIQLQLSINSHRDYATQVSILNIAAIAARTRALGPGTRAVVWVQGCPLKCPGCLAPQWIPFVPATQLTPEEVIARLDLEAISGLTFSGGEPMMQAPGLAELARLARQQQDLDIICFTGFRYERLLKNPPAPGISDLLSQIDVLVDGPFVQSLHDSIGLRGSSNQRIIHMTPRLKRYDLESQTRNVELTISDGELGLIGIPTPAMLSALRTSPYGGMERMG